MDKNWLKSEINRLQSGVDGMNEIENPTEYELEIKRKLSNLLEVYTKTYEELIQGEFEK